MKSVEESAVVALDGANLVLFAYLPCILQLIPSILLCCILIATTIYGKSYYVAQQGSDSDSGSFVKPFATIGAFHVHSIIVRDTITADGRSMILIVAFNTYSGIA